MTTESNFCFLASQVLSGEALPEEKAKLQDILIDPFYANAYVKLKKSYRQTDHWPNENIFDAHKAWGKWQNNMSENDIQVSRDNKTRLLTRRLLQYAASILLVLSLASGWYFLFNNHAPSESSAAIYTTSAGQRSTFLLPDGSKVTLNALSTLTVDKAFGRKLREVELSGEAFFEVTPNTNKPFVVKTASLTTTVLGTAFNIYAYPNEATIVCVEHGKVKVAELGGNSITLTKGELAQLNPDTHTIIKTSGASSKPFDWQNDILRFDEITLQQAITKMNRWYSTQIQCSDSLLLNRKVRGVYSNEQIVSVISDLQFMLDFNYRFHTNGDITLYR